MTWWCCSADFGKHDIHCKNYNGGQLMNEAGSTEPTAIELTGGDLFRELGSRLINRILSADAARDTNDVEERLISIISERNDLRIYDTITSLEMNEEFLNEVYDAMKHAEVFISSREKMHPDGVKLFEETMAKVKRRVSSYG